MNAKQPHAGAETGQGCIGGPADAQPDPETATSRQNAKCGECSRAKADDPPAELVERARKTAHSLTQCIDNLHTIHDDDVRHAIYDACKSYLQAERQATAREIRDRARNYRTNSGNAMAAWIEGKFGLKGGE